MNHQSLLKQYHKNLQKVTCSCGVRNIYKNRINFFFDEISSHRIIFLFAFLMIFFFTVHPILSLNLTFRIEARNLNLITRQKNTMKL